MSFSHCEECQEALPGLLEGDLGGDEAERLRAHLEGCPDCRAEYDWLATAVLDLQDLGDAIVRNAPAIDLVDSVLREADAIDQAAVTVPFRPRRGGRLRLFAPALAAAAALALFAWIVVRDRDAGRTPAPPPDTTPIVQAPAPSVTSRPPTARAPRSRREMAQVPDRLIEMLDRQRLPERPNVAAVTDPELTQRVTVDDIVRERRRAVGDRDAWSQLAQWATLSREDARRLASNPEASPGIVVAAAEALEADEAEAYLLSAVGRHPQDPYLQMALARGQAFSGSPSTADPAAAAPADPYEGLDAIQEMKQLDPENALSYYMEAELLLRNGDVSGALNALAQAQTLALASPYTLQAAQSREQALIAGGMDPASARLLAALTAGIPEYEFLYGLGSDLLEYGRSYAELNLLTEARAIFEGVQTMGSQVESSANFSREQLAGLELRLDAQAELEGLYHVLGADVALQQLYQQTELLWSGIESLTRFFDDLNQLVLKEDHLWTFIADTILRGGDLGLLP